MLDNNPHFQIVANEIFFHLIGKYLWLTRNYSGVGFLDGGFDGLGPLKDIDLGQVLTTEAHILGTSEVCLGVKYEDDLKEGSSIYTIDFIH
jgi:hypothetical protein